MEGVPDTESVSMCVESTWGVSMRPSHLFTVLFSGLFAIGFSTLSHAQNLATVGSKSISVKEFRDRYEDVKRQVINPPEPPVFLEDLIRLEVGLQEAEKMNLKNDPIVQRQIDEVIYRNYLEKVLAKDVEKITVNEAEMRRYYKDNPEVRTSHILIEFKPGASEQEIAAAKKRADELYAEVKASKRPFEDLVKLYSDEALSKQTGGDIGYQSRATIAPTYYETALQMKNGEIRGPIRTRYGFHIMKLTGKRDFEQADRAQIRTVVFNEKRRQIFETHFANLKKKYKIDVNKALVDKLK